MKRDWTSIACAGAAVAAGCLLAISSIAAAQEDQTPRMSRDEAREYMTAYFAGRPQFSECGRALVRTFQRVDTAQINDSGITVSCENGREVVLSFEDYPSAWVMSGSSRPAIVIGSTPAGPVFSDMDNAYRFRGAWLGLQREPLLDPTSDAAFQAALQQARASTTDRTEDQRRAQVRAEAFIGAGRTADALEVYQTAFASSPDWATGHYNAALVAAELEQYELAITEMRRYVFLEPNAPDIRAAQDQIYRWEALLE